MPPRALNKEAIIIILDVGKNVSEYVDTKSSTFLQLSTLCISRILQRKIFIRSKDEIGLILLGCDNTDNSLNYPNISIGFSIGLPSWERISYTEKDIPKSSSNGDWIEAIVLAMQMLKDETEERTFSKKSIVLFTNCTSEAADDHIDNIIEHMKAMEIAMIAIGPDVIPSDEDDRTITKSVIKSEIQTQGEIILSKLIGEVDGLICTFDDAIEHLLYFRTKSVNPTPWNVMLEIGPDIKIPVSGFKKIAEVVLPSWNRASSLDKNSSVLRETAYFKTSGDQAAVEKKDITKGYHFGSTLVPFFDNDADEMSYNSGRKCLSVLGFTDSKNVPRDIWLGTGALYITVQKDKLEAGEAFSAIVQALENLNMVAIVRRVYNSNTAVHIGALFPKIGEGCECLAYIELPFSEDVREYVFPSLSEINKLRKEQLDAIDKLIDCMDLSSDNDEGIDTYEPNKVINPYHHYFYTCLSNRALNPTEELPCVSEQIKAILKTPFENKKEFVKAMEELNSVFELKEGKKLKHSTRAADIFKQVPEISKSNESVVSLDFKTKDIGKNIICEVGYVTPKDDFIYLLTKGKSIDKVCEEIKDVIYNLVKKSFATLDYGKALDALEALRKTCIENNLQWYDTWLKDFKEKIITLQKSDFWDLVISKELGFIANSENAPTKEENLSLRSEINEPDANDLIMEM